ncbi:selection and upkeep of intraepithelial T-cells protein 9-like [Bos taurus]|uniref:selection and upkeep of intraepithelial T-cells protein 9-like n=1 Tax=Bos taurus TaxID=9913 RepID=UPI000383AA10|nr:selection and upkeep of intraepithelial T-cells protein 9-like [Bos taurus]XP_059741126.1 selection and upkeep of intraepithelial T-cells protein 9-like [Bos taurus]XP_059741127.1 selection and upkeep of intraepithelial T-cells protein 9-like [Bos taurus]
MLECNSGGWFPSPQVEWRDSRGNVIPHSSKSSSVDGAGLLHLKMSVLLKNSTHSPVTCCVCNPVTGQEKRAGVILPDILFKSKSVGMLCENLYLLIYLIILLVVSCILLGTVSQNRWFVLFSFCIPFVIYAGISPVYLKFKIGVSDSDDLFPLYSTWIRDICVILTVLMIFFPVLISCLLQTLEGKARREGPL